MGDESVGCEADVTSLTGKEKTNVISFAHDRLDRVAFRGVSCLAIQQELGLLSEQHGGRRVGDYYHPFTLGPNLNAPTTGKIFRILLGLSETGRGDAGWHVILERAEPE